jgi:hypothetical protein
MREAWEAIRKPCEKAGYDYGAGLAWNGPRVARVSSVIYRPGFGQLFNGDRIRDFVLKGMTFGNSLDINNPAWKMDVGCNCRFHGGAAGGANCS